MKESLFLNCLRISEVSKEIECFLVEENDSYDFKLKSYEFEFLDEKNSTDKDSYYFSLKSLKNGSPVSITFKTRSSKRKFLTAQLFKEFTKEGHIVDLSFIDSIDVWIRDQKIQNLETFQKFNLKIDNVSFVDELVLTVSYGGEARIHSKTMSELNLSGSEGVSKVLKGSQIFRAKLLGDNLKGSRPVLSFSLSKKLNIPANFKYIKNKYIPYLEKIKSFTNSCLIPLFEKSEVLTLKYKSFIEIPKKEVKHFRGDANLLEFGNNNTHYNAYMGLKKYGPYETINENPHFIFIFKKSSKELANKLHLFFKKGLGGFPGMQPFVGINYSLDAENSIQLDNDDINIEELKSKINEKKLSENENLFAFVLHDVDKNNASQDELNKYFEIKKVLLESGVGSQVIFEENISKSNFSYFLPNICIALLAKLGGIPWKLQRPLEAELVVGVGAYKSIDDSNKFLGNCFCFDNSGKFLELKLQPAATLNDLARGVSEFIKQKIQTEGISYKRVIVHFYKAVSNRDEKIFLSSLEENGTELPIVFLTLNKTESKDMVLFDEGYNGFMPVSGTYVRVKKDEYLVCNNTRYSGNTYMKVDSFPFPVKIKIKSSNSALLKDAMEVEILLDQVYQFSRMYWKSVKQKERPVTIIYSEILAELSKNIPGVEVPASLRDKLWFL